MEALRRRFPAVDFVKIYVSEAHPIDEWRCYAEADVDYAQPTRIADRLAAARRLLDENDIGVVDLSDDIDILDQKPGADGFIHRSRLVSHDTDTSKHQRHHANGKPRQQEKTRRGQPGRPDGSLLPSSRNRGE